MTAGQIVLAIQKIVRQLHYPGIIGMEMQLIIYDSGTGFGTQVFYQHCRYHGIAGI
jgi:phage terminase large subunit GpA-like protein